MLMRRLRPFLALAILGLVIGLVAVDQAEARRGFSFGSRGARTYVAPKPTTTAPAPAAPVERSMTPRTATETSRPAAGAPAMQDRRGLFGGGFFGSMLGGLALGGLIGILLGNGIGGFAGVLGFLLQGALIVGAVMLAMRFLRRQPAPAAAGIGAMGRGFERRMAGDDDHASTGRAGGLRVPSIGGATPAVSRPAPNAFSEGDEIGVTPADLDAFERLLSEVLTAYAAEDFAAIRARTTPEVMGFLAEEIGRSASQGLTNEIHDIKLLQGDVAEAWREGETEYATVAMRYSAIEVTRERASGRVVEGDADRHEETTEIWTFVRRGGEDWLLSAIQPAN